MKSIDRTMYRGVLFAGVLVAVFASGPVHAHLHLVCADKWAESEAADYCSASDIGTVFRGVGRARHCSVSGTCSITVDVDDESTTFNLGMERSQSPNDTADLDICFAADSAGTSGFSATVKAGCASTETDSDDAVDNGLSTD